MGLRQESGYPCEDLPTQVCEDLPTQVCEDLPTQVCEDLPTQVCKDLPTQVCEPHSSALPSIASPTSSESPLASLLQPPWPGVLQASDDSTASSATLWACCRAGQLVQEKTRDPGGGPRRLLHLPAVCPWDASRPQSRALPSAGEERQQTVTKVTKSNCGWKREGLCTAEVGGAGVGGSRWGRLLSVVTFKLR